MSRHRPRQRFSRRPRHHYNQRDRGGDNSQRNTTPSSTKSPEVYDGVSAESTESDLTYLPAMFFSHPELLGRVEWVSLRGADQPSAPVPLRRSRHLFGPNHPFMKVEEFDLHVMPDNKAKKLEFILGDALSRGVKRIVTVGYCGSSHCLATAKAASILGLSCEIVLLKSPLNRKAVEMIAAMKKLGAAVRLCETEKGAYWWGIWNWLVSKIIKTEMIPPGGSTGHGALGTVSSLFELKAHSDEGIIPRPQMLFVPAGSGSTLVGLVLAKKWLQWDELQIFGVQVSDHRGVDKTRLIKMAEEATAILNQSLKTPLSFKFVESDFQVLTDYVFDTHGKIPPHIERWSNAFQELEPYALDATYTAKALYGMSDYLKKNKIAQKVVLFWNTLSPMRKGDIPSPLKTSFIPRTLRRWIREEQKAGGLVDIPKI